MNAPLLAEQRGIAVRLLKDDVSDEYRTVITLSGALSDGSQLSVSGTLTGPKQTEKLVGINDHTLELPIETNHVVMLYTDRPGIVAVYGQKFGEAGINIAGMQIARQAAGAQALSVLTLDSPVSEELLEDVSAADRRRPLPPDRDHRGLIGDSRRRAGERDAPALLRVFDGFRPSPSAPVRSARRGSSLRGTSRSGPCTSSELLK